MALGGRAPHGGLRCGDLQRQARIQGQRTRRGALRSRALAGSSIRGGGSCSSSGNGASSYTFSTSRGAGTPAVPHAAEGVCGGWARLPARPSVARPGPHFKALLTTSPAVRSTSASAAPQRVSQRARATPRATAAPLTAGMREREGRVSRDTGASADRNRSSSTAPPPLTEELQSCTLE